MNSGWQIAEPTILRFLLALVVLRYAMPTEFVFSQQRYPVGLARLADMSLLAKPSVYRVLRGLGLLSLLVYVSGLNVVFPLTFVFLFCLLYQTLRNCQGGAVHASQALVLVLGIQLWGALSSAGSYELAFHWSQQAIIAVYFTSAVTKLLRSGRRWLEDSPFIALQFIKSSNQEYYGTGDDRRLVRIRVLAEWILRNPKVCRVLFSSGLILELLSPLFLLHHYCAIFGGICLLLFHLSIWHAMRIQFACLASLMTIFLFDLPALVLRFVL